MQINEKFMADEAARFVEGNLTSIRSEGNVAFAKYLYQQVWIRPMGLHPQSVGLCAIARL